MQMVLQGLWFEKDSSLLMLPNMNDDLIKNSATEWNYTIATVIWITKIFFAKIIAISSYTI